MSAQGVFSIGGIASGLDTSGIIEQLMALERQPVRRMESRQAQLRSVDSAWQQITTKLSSLRTAIDTINRPDRFSSLVSVSSTNTDAASVAKAAVAGTGSLTFHVDQLARAHQAASGTYGTATDLLSASGTLSVAQGGAAPVTIDVDAADSLQDIAGKLNDLKAGFTASVVKTAEGEHRLVLDATSTGTANDLEITSSGTGLDQFTAFHETDNANGLRTLQEATDAKVRLGSADGITITRSSNTIDDLVPGASITLKSVTTETAPDGTPRDGVPVTVSAQHDVDGGLKAVKSYVDALNGAIETLASMTRYDAETQKAGALQGDASARQLLNQLRSAATAPLGVTAEPFSGAFDVGMSVDRHGKVILDETKLQAALTEDFVAVGRVFSRNGTTTDPLATGAVGTTKTAAGTYDVRVTAAATAARATGAIFGPDGPSEPKTFRITSGGRVATITLDTTSMSRLEIVNALNAALEAAKIGSITASDDGDDLVLQKSDFGTAASFTVEELDGDGVAVATPTWFTETTYAGTDAAGEIEVGGAWEPLQGTGRSLTASSGPAEGLRFTWTGTDPILVGTPVEFAVSSTHGLAGNLDTVLREAEGSFGLVARARQGITDQIEVQQTRIDGFEQRLETRERTLIRQFTAMETALSKLNAQGSWLTSQLAGLNGMSQQQ